MYNLMPQLIITVIDCRGLLILEYIDRLAWLALVNFLWMDITGV
jgi:hypothetical protein